MNSRLEGPFPCFSSFPSPWMMSIRESLCFSSTFHSVTQNLESCCPQRLRFLKANNFTASARKLKWNRQCFPFLESWTRGEVLPGHWVPHLAPCYIPSPVACAPSVQVSTQWERQIAPSVTIGFISLRGVGSGSGRLRCVLHHLCGYCSGLAVVVLMVGRLSWWWRVIIPATIASCFLYGPFCKRFDSRSHFSV